MSFDLTNYEDVNSRIKRFRSEFPSGRLVAYIEDIDVVKGFILMRAEAYRDDTETVPAAVDYAFEIRTDRGVNQLNWVENCTTSVYGRVIGLLTPSEVNRATVQDMQRSLKSQRLKLKTINGTNGSECQRRLKQLPRLSKSSGANYKTHRPAVSMARWSN